MRRWRNWYTHYLEVVAPARAWRFESSPAHKFMNITGLDRKIIAFLNKNSIPFDRIAIFIIFFWFGFLKVINLSPADALVADLLKVTIPSLSLGSFFVFLGIWEMAIGILFLIPKLTRIAIPLLLIHMFSTLLPLVLLPQVVWQQFLVPTLEGQYIIKNLIIVALALAVAASVTPMKSKENVKV